VSGEYERKELSAGVRSQILAPPARYLDHLDRGVVAWGRRDLSVTRKERRFDHFRKGYVNGVVCRQSHSEFPHSGQQKIVGIAVDWEIVQVF
jgi:hypothetical protein